VIEWVAEYDAQGQCVG